MTQRFQPADQARFDDAIRRFDDENAQDPNVQFNNGLPAPRELVYARWLTDWVNRLCPQASEALRLAARCQHLRRWAIPRESYPMTRAGYLKWRQDLKQFHADKAGEILRETGYPDEIVARVQSLNLKKGLPHDAETQVLEDALCLVFLEKQLDELAAKTADDKVVNALRKSWGKMSAAGRERALTLPLSERAKALVNQALAVG
jgi:hypothetical protein